MPDSIIDEDERYVRERIKYEYIMALDSILSNEQKIQDAIEGRETFLVEGKRIEKKEVAKVLSHGFDQGKLLPDNPLKVTLRVPGREEEVTKKYGLNENKLSTREKLIIDAVTFQIGFQLMLNPEFFPRGSTEAAATVLQERKEFFNQLHTEVLAPFRKDELGMKSGYQMHEQFKNSINEAKSKSQYNLLLHAENQAVKKDKANLHQLTFEIDKINRNWRMTPNQKNEQIIALLEDRLSKLQNKSTKRFLRSDRPVEYFVKQIWDKPKDHQCEIAIAKLLKDEYDAHPELKKQFGKMINPAVVDMIVAEGKQRELAQEQQLSLGQG